jgi:hypothetical protein
VLTEGEAAHSLQCCAQVKTELASLPLPNIPSIKRELSHELYSVLMGTFYPKREVTKDLKKLLN